MLGACITNICRRPRGLDRAIAGHGDDQVSLDEVERVLIQVDDFDVRARAC
jgi:hypothetical protein